MDQTLAEVWRPILGGGPGVSWVVFENGTCVVLENPEGDLVAQAIEVLKRWGPVHAGSSFGDFRVVDLENGWIVTSHSCGGYARTEDRSDRHAGAVQARKGHQGTPRCSR